MSTSMVSTVLDIEREAEAILAEAARDAEEVLANAKKQRAEASAAFEDQLKKDVADLEEKAGSERAKKVRELTASGETALSAVRNISDAAFDSGVQYVMKTLANL